TVSGSSLGGMQVLEWGILFSDFCHSIIPISTSAAQTAWCIGLNAAARAAIMNDPDWENGHYSAQPARGLALARMIGMISYRSPAEFSRRFGRTRGDESGNPYDPDNFFEIERYLFHHGQKLVDRFDANTYLLLSRTMDLHDVTAGRGALEEVLGSITARTLCIGVSSDHRYPPADQHEIVRWLRHGEYREISSLHGHDAFLIEFEQLNFLIHQFLRTFVS
ncbi:MAG: homoserine O-acetyltransferase, partial [Bacteroidota bacterium]